MDSVDRYKAQARADLTRDSNLDKASVLVAKRNDAAILNVGVAARFGCIGRLNEK